MLDRELSAERITAAGKGLLAYYDRLVVRRTLAPSLSARLARRLTTFVLPANE
jgi:hypothetical protein